jgi:2-haloacid dehalogenase
MKFLFDLGGVFFDWDPNHFFINIFKDLEERQYFLNEICNDAWNIQQDAGRLIKDAELELIQKFPKYEKQIKMYYANHRNMIKGTFTKSIEILNYLKKNNYECYVLSNWSAETFIGMTEDYPFLKKFDGLLISGEDKLIKPNLAIYQLAIERFDLDPAKCVFIDDKLENIETAKKLSFHTIHLTNPKTINAEIKKYLN